MGNFLYLKRNNENVVEITLTPEPVKKGSDKKISITFGKDKQGVVEEKCKKCTEWVYHSNTKLQLEKKLTLFMLIDKKTGFSDFEKEEIDSFDIIVSAKKDDLIYIDYLPLIDHFDDWLLNDTIYNFIYLLNLDLYMTWGLGEKKYGAKLNRLSTFRTQELAYRLYITDTDYWYQNMYGFMCRNLIKHQNGKDIYYCNVSLTGIQDLTRQTWISLVDGTIDFKKQNLNQACANADLIEWLHSIIKVEIEGLIYDGEEEPCDEIHLIDDYQTKGKFIKFIHITPKYIEFQEKIGQPLIIDEEMAKQFTLLEAKLAFLRRRKTKFYVYIDNNLKITKIEPVATNKGEN